MNEETESKAHSKRSRTCSLKALETLADQMNDDSAEPKIKKVKSSTKLAGKGSKQEYQEDEKSKPVLDNKLPLTEEAVPHQPHEMGQVDGSKSLKKEPLSKASSKKKEAKPKAAEEPKSSGHNAGEKSSKTKKSTTLPKIALNKSSTLTKKAGPSKKNKSAVSPKSVDKSSMKKKTPFSRIILHNNAALVTEQPGPSKSKVTKKTSATNAKTSATITNAKTSATNTKTSATDTKTSATNAKTSAAKTSATNAKTSAAKTSATNAKTSAAKTSATNAKTSDTNGSASNCNKKKRCMPKTVDKLLEKMKIKPKKVSSCLKAAMCKGFIDITGDPSDLEQVVVEGEHNEHSFKVLVKDILYQPDYGGHDYEDGSIDATALCICCPEEHAKGDYGDYGKAYVTRMCGGKPDLDDGKFHNHCTKCKGFGICINDYRETHCKKCGKHYFQGSWGGSCHHCKRSKEQKRSKSVPNFLLGMPRYGGNGCASM